jgi:hypothetical protein
MKQHMLKRMQRLMSRDGARALALSLGMAAAGAAAPVWATIPDANGLLHGCRHAINGQVRLIDPSAGAVCNPSEVPVTWNQTGPQGSQGPQGPAGFSGTSQAFFAHNSHIVDVEGTDLDGSQEIVGLTPAGRFLRDLDHLARSALSG